MSLIYTEFELIKEIRKKLSYSPDVIKGIGDDCAVVKNQGKYTLLTIDNMVENIHFDMTIQKNIKNIGFKAVSRAISDIAAMGGIPKYILVSLAISTNFNKTSFKAISSGIKQACKYYNTELVGGDITKSKATAITVAVIGVCDAKPVFRSGALVSDNIYVSGDLGLASAGLALLKAKKNVPKKLLNAYEKPIAQIALGNLLRKKAIVTSMIDISDGVLGDLKHILEESKKGALLDITSLPTPKLLKTLFKKEEYINFVLNGGDDYQLLFTTREKHHNDILKISRELKIPITKIGKIVKTGFYIKENNKTIKVTTESYQHKFTFDS